MCACRQAYGFKKPPTTAERARLTCTCQVVTPVPRFEPEQLLRASVKVSASRLSYDILFSHTLMQFAAVSQRALPLKASASNARGTRGLPWGQPSACQMSSNPIVVPSSV